MSNKTVEIKVSEEEYALIKKAAEHGRRKGRGEPVSCTIGEMAADYVKTGIYRRLAANKWAKAHPVAKVAKVKKPAKVKAASPKKISKPKTQKTTPKKAGGGSKKSVKVKAPASKSAAAPAPSSMLE